MNTSSLLFKRAPLALALASALSIVTLSSGAAAAGSTPAAGLAHLTPDERAALITDRKASHRVGSHATERATAWMRSAAHSPADETLWSGDTLTGTVHNVTNCADSGPGSLRNTVGNADDGDTIDLSSLNCSTITLTTGAIVVSQSELSILGPGANELSVSGNNNSQIFAHTGSSLTIDGLTIADGFKYSASDDARGGCIFSTGTVDIENTIIRDCLVATVRPQDAALGGALYASRVTLTDSVIQGNNAQNKYESTCGLDACIAAGGGVFAQNALSLRNSLVIDNHAFSQNGSSLGGGVFIPGPASGEFVSKYSSFEQNSALLSGAIASNTNSLLTGTSIVMNQAGRAAGGILGGDGRVTRVHNSTVSSNISTDSQSPALVCAGLVVRGESSVTASTIAFNVAEAGGGDDEDVVGGLCSDGDLRLESTILANNFAGATPSDLEIDDGAVTGADNLVMASMANVPEGTLVGVEPRLGSLALRGARTWNHAPKGFSVVIDRGNTAGGGDFDQRGEGYARIVGAAADIGSIELDDLIFAHDFELPIQSP